MTKKGVLSSRIVTARYLYLFLFCWTSALGISFYYNFSEIYSNIYSLAKNQADMSYQKDLLYRRWNARNGGVYVPIDSINIPNPHLNIPNRDITLENGREYTLINPAYMTRQVYELENKELGIIGHLTSLKPIRPENHADNWESDGLNSFEMGQTEKVEILNINNERVLRFIRPFLTEKSCLKCHSFQGYKEGDIRGGISINIQMEQYYKVADTQRNLLIVGHIGIWILGCLIFGIAFFRIRADSESLTESEKKFRQLFNTISDPIIVFIYNPDEPYNSKIMLANDVASEFFKYSKEEFLHKNFDELTHSETSTHDGSFQTKLENLEKFEATFYSKEGNALYVELNPQKFIFQGEDALLIIVRDITERKKNEEKEKQFTEKLVRINSDKDKLFSIIAHDLRNPFMALLSLSELLNTEWENLPDDERKSFILQIHRAADNTHTLLNNLLLWARNQKNMIEFSPESIKLEEMLKRCTNYFESIAHKKSIAISIKTEPGAAIFADKNMIEVVFRNLISNSLKFTNHNGEIIISTVCDSSKTVICFSDNGIGMDETIKENLFNLGKISSRPGTDREKGTGLGLLLCKEFVEKNFGVFEVESKLGEGTKFLITLPSNQA